VSETKDGGSAFPHQECRLNFLDAGGMSLRDYFAAKALPVVMQASDIQEVLKWRDWAKKVTEASYEVADAMLRAREAK
jgi:hypothetical protein